MRLRRPHARDGVPRSIGILAQAAYDDPSWAFLERRAKAGLDRFRPFRSRPAGFPVVERRRPPPQDPVPDEGTTGAPVMAWTVRTAGQREAALKWADQMVFDGEFWE